MAIDMDTLLERVADFRFEAHYRQYPFTNKLSNPQDSDGRPIQWLKSFQIEVRDLLDEMEEKASYVREPNLYAQGKRLLQDVTDIIAPYSVNYLVFEELVKAMPYKRIVEEMPGSILMNLANHTYDLPKAVSALNGYLELCEGRFGPFPNADEIRDELIVIELMESMR